MLKPGPIEDRFWPKVDIKGKDECWNWKASKIGKGYGGFWDKERHKFRCAHRISWELANGPIPDKGLILHTCDNMLCVNPNHLYLGTQSDNMCDMVVRNRCTKSKFYESEAWLMKKLYKYGKLRRSKKFTLEQLAKMFKCSKGTISDIVNERTTNFKIFSKEIV